MNTNIVKERPSFATSCIGILLFCCIVSLFTACRSGNKSVRVGGFEIDSVVVDTTLALTQAEGAPACQLSLHLHFLKEKKAQAMNDTLLRAGILLPDYFSLSKEKLSVRELVDSFVGRYLEEYRTEYAPLYQADREHATAYNVQYSVRSHFEKNADDVLTNIADIYTYGGGAHGIKQTLALNIDTKKNQLIRLSDLFIDGSEPLLKDIIIQHIGKQHEAESLADLQAKGIFADGEVYLSENFILGKDDITFIYGEDEIAPHAVGEIRVKVDLDDLKKFLK